ncbi:MAG: hypothetical protein WC458_00555 [Patescibacteria group bacterium]
MKNHKITISLWAVCLALAVLALPAISRAQVEIDPDFNPHRILEDSELLNYNAMSLADIQNFLQAKGSFLASYTTIDTYGNQKTAAEIIYNATHNNYDCDNADLSDEPTETEKSLKCRHITTVNPKFILVLLQKESSLIEDSSPSQSNLDWATGYGCPDNWVCNPYYKGFGKQVNSAALQFYAYMTEPNRYNYKAGQTYTISNTIQPYCVDSNQIMSVTPQNLATAGLYNYTPHVFNGNYNVYKLWNRYFPKVSRLYPDSSIIKAMGDPQIWLIENGKKRHFANWSAFISRFHPEQIVEVNSADLDNYPNGEEIKFANYSLVRTPDKKTYLLVDKEKRPFASDAVFKKIGFNPEEVEKATSEDLVGYSLGKTITATSTYVTGALLQDSKTGDVFYVENGIKAPVDKILLKTKFAEQKIIKKTTKELKVYATSTPILLNEGTLVKTENFPLVYLISDGKKRPIDDATFLKLGYNPKNVITVSSQFLYNYDAGEAVK